MVFLVGTSTISVFDRQSRSRVAAIAAPQNIFLYIDRRDPGWNTLHHDVRGGHLLATSQSGHLFWTPRYRDALQGTMKGAILVTDRRLIELSVENGRVAFVAAVRLFPPSTSSRMQDNLTKKYTYNFRARAKLTNNFKACSCFTSKTGTQKRSSRDQSCRSSALVTP
jgi:hypothetical protein